MSGFAGIIDRSGIPVDAASLACMAQRCERHGGAAPSLVRQSSFGFAHALLESTPQSKNEEQPLSFDGETWIVGDVRLDARSELIAELKQAGQDVSPDRPDIDLALKSWSAWGENCVQHLLGDFSFAIWNRATQSLFCARDHFGVKPFYYSRNSVCFVFSNDIDAVRSHPAVADRLNDQAICDYFVFGYNLDENSTCYDDVDRLPPGHVLTLESGRGARLRNYREIDVSGRIEYRDFREYTEHFNHLFAQAVSDRLRADAVCFELSGGMDSTSVAATAASLNAGNAKFCGLGITTSYTSGSTEDQEAHFARLVARTCGLNHLMIEAGREEDLYRYCTTAQPYAWPFAATTVTFATAARAHGNVLLSGQFGDVLMQGSGSALRDEFRERSLAAFALERIRAVFHKRSLRALGIRTLAGRSRPNIPLPRIPVWVREEALKHSRSAERWKELFCSRNRIPKGCRAERAFDELRMPFWSHLFESYYHDLMWGIDCRHPFLDLRLVEFAFAVPPSVKVNKRLVREAMANVLPESIATRNKTVVSQDMVQKLFADRALYRQHKKALTRSGRWIDEETYSSALDRYASGQDEDPFTILCPLSFEHWHRHRQVIR